MDRQERAAWATRIQAARRDQHLSQSELAASVGISRRQLGKIERGEEIPRSSTLEKLLDVLGLHVHDPQIDADTDALLVLLGSLIRRLPPSYVAEWSSRVTGELAAAIAEQAEAPPEWGEMIDLIRRAENGHESGVSDAARDTG